MECGVVDIPSPEREKVLKAMLMPCQLFVHHLYCGQNLGACLEGVASLQTNNFSKI